MKRSPLKKKSPVKTSVLKRKLWTLFSKYIRERDKYKCITCGITLRGSSMHAGHFIPRSVGGIQLYFDERNVNAQCYRDNIHLGGYGAKYSEVMVKKYGQEVVDELWRIKQTTMKTSDFPFEEKIAYYTEKLKEYDI